MVNWLHISLAVGMLISGCVNTISKKAQNRSVAPGYDPEPHSFTHPWFQTIIMFLGEFLCFFGFLYQRNKARKLLSGETNSSDIQSDKSPEDKEKQQKELDAVANTRVWQPILMLPTFLDLLGTSLGGIGLVYCEASIWQMLRGSIIVFTGLLSWVFLKRKIALYRWFAIFLTICGLAAVGYSNILIDNEKSESSSVGSGERFSLLTIVQDVLLGSSSGGGHKEPGKGMVVVGILCILCGQLVAAMQMVVEEKLLKGRSLAPMHIVGLEGMIGFLLMLFVVLPAMFFIPGNQKSPVGYDTYENSWDAILQMGHSTLILCCGILYCLSIAFYNFFGLSVTKHLTCVHRTLIDACRTIFVWSFDLIVGIEHWSVWSFLELGGFAFLICGTLIYNGIIKLPCFSYADPNVCKKPEEKNEDKSDDEKQPLLASDNKDSINN